MSIVTITVSTVVVAIVMSVVMSVRASGHRTRGHRTPDTGHVRADTRTRRTADMSERTRGHGSDKARRLAMYVAILAGVFTTLLTIAAFVLSYAHLENVAVANGVPSGFLAWMWPGTIDTFIVVGELLILFAAILGLGFAWWGWGLTVGGSMTSIAFNVAGVGGDARLMEYAVAAAPPVAALFAFGALMHQVRQYVATYVVVSARTSDTASDMSARTSDTGDSGHVRSDKPADIVSVSAPVSVRPDIPQVAMSAPPRPAVRPSGQADIGHVRTDKPADIVSARTSDTRTSGHADMSDVRLSGRTDKATDPVRADRVRRVRAELAKGTDMTGRAVADMFAGITPRTGQRILAEARDAA